MSHAREWWDTVASACDRGDLDRAIRLLRAVQMSQALPSWEGHAADAIEAALRLHQLGCPVSAADAGPLAYPVLLDPQPVGG